MPDRTLTFAYTACAVFAAVIAFLLATTAERTLFVLEDAPVVWITENDESHDNDEVAATVQRVADEHDAAIGYAIADVQEPTTRIHLYLAVSDPESRHAAWAEDGYPTFGRGFTIDTYPIADFGDVGPNGHYLVLDAPEAEEALRTELAALGLHEAPGTQAVRMWHYFTGGHLFNLLMVALLGTMAAAGAGVLLGSRDYGVMRLQGRSYPSILGHDLLRTARSTAVALAVIVLGTLAFLGWYNEWNQLGFYARTALLFFGALFVPCLLVHAATLALVHTTRILPSLKGRLPLKATTTAIYLVRAPSLVLALVILGGVASYSQNVRDLETALELHEEQGETSFPSLSANYGWSDDEAVDEELGPWLREVDASGDMVLAVHEYPLLSTPYDSRPTDAAPPEPPLLVVNDTYLAEQEVLSPTGEPYGPDEHVRVLVPENATVDTEELTEAVRGQWVETSDASDGVLEIEVLPAAAEQTLFTYSAKRFDAPRPYLPLLYEPVVVVLPNGGVLSDGAYVSHMTRGSTIFPDPEVVTEYRDRVPEASRYLAMVETLSTSARDELARHLIVLRGELFNLVGVAVVLLLTGMAACVVHVRTRAQEIFVRHISGWTFLATHRRLLFVEGVLALGFLSWAAWDTLRRLAVTSDPMYGGPLEAAPSGAEPFYALGIVLVCLAATAAALALFHRRIVREGASQA